jgi:hypothetical protein
MRPVVLGRKNWTLCSKERYQRGGHPHCGELARLGVSLRENLLRRCMAWSTFQFSAFIPARPLPGSCRVAERHGLSPAQQKLSVVPPGMAAGWHNAGCRNCRGEPSHSGSDCECAARNICPSTRPRQTRCTPSPDSRRTDRFCRRGTSSRVVVRWPDRPPMRTGLIRQASIPLR